MSKSALSGTAPWFPADSNPLFFDQFLAPLQPPFASDLRGLRTDSVLNDLTLAQLGIQRVLSQSVSGRDFLQHLAEVHATPLARLYLFRREHELFFRELKTALLRNGLLASQTVDTDGQEVAALLICAAIIAEERAALETGAEPTHRVSLLKTVSWLEPLWLTLAITGQLLSSEQKQAMADEFRKLIQKLSRNKRRVRSCPRAVRQPIGKWPRKINQTSKNTPCHLKITRGP